MKAEAFTLVELAIVLVVIGIIAAMAIAGTDVLSTAQVRGEISKISKIEAALATYRNDNARFPKVDNNTNAMDMQALTNYGISRKEMRSKYAEQVNADAFEMRMCSPDNESYLVDSGSNVCLIFGLLDVSQAMHDFFICSFENLFDDKNVKRSLGRQVKRGSIMQIPDNVWGNPKDYNCDNAGSTSYHNYTYKIF